jgi:hypothetical protein
LGRVGKRHRHVLTGARALLAPLGPLLVGAAAMTTSAIVRIAAAENPTPTEGATTTTATTTETSAEPAAPVAIIGPVLTIGPPPSTELRKVVPTDPAAIRARELLSALKDAAQDLDLALDLTATITDDGVKDLDLVKRASAGAWVISARLEPTGKDAFILRIIAVPPKSATMLVRVEKVEGPRVAVRGVVMLRDFVSMKLGASPQPTTADDAVPRPEDEAVRSRGRPILAASTTLFGLYAAFSIHRSSQSDDPRLLYPLLALGSGVGLGASLLAADEWNVTPGAAWTVAGGTWWGVVAGLNIAAGRNVQPTEDRFAWGLAGGLAGTTLAVSALAATRYDDGDAALVHSGAAIGTFTGGILEGIYCGNVKGCEQHGGTPSTGLGYGSALGLLGGGILGAVVNTSSNRVLFVDLGAGLGALGGASLASPFLFKDASEKKHRIFLAGVLAGTAIGGTLAWIITRERPTPPPPEKKAGITELRPQAGVLGMSVDPKTGAQAPIFGMGLVGAF